MKKLDTLIFDLDGTLLPMDTDAFMTRYNELIGAYFTDLIDPNTFIKALWTSTKETIDNLEHKKNYDVFKEAMANKLEGDMSVYYDRIYEFYDEDFLHLGELTAQSKDMIKAIQLLKEKGYRLLIATNPLFPLKANYHRIGWAGLSPEDFDYISCFEENHYCKPHLEFYKEVIELNDLDTSSVLMVGNDVDENLVVKKLGVQTYLIENHILHRGGKAYETDYKGNYENFLTFVEELAVIKK